MCHYMKPCRALLSQWEVQKQTKHLQVGLQVEVKTQRRNGGCVVEDLLKTCVSVFIAKFLLCCPDSKDTTQCKMK